MLFAAKKRPEIVRQGSERKPIKRGGKRVGTRTLAVTRFVPDWSNDVSVQFTSMALTEGALFAAGPPDLQDEEESVKTFFEPETKAKLAEQSAAYEGKQGGLLVAVSRTDGQKLAAYRLESMPRFDGLIAANGRLYAATIDGQVLCFGGDRGRPLPSAEVVVTPRPEEKPLEDTPDEPTTARVPPPELKLPSAAEDFAQATGVHVFRTASGYLVHAAEQKGGSYALKRLEAPLTGKVAFRVKLDMDPAVAPSLGRSNGHFVFGSRSDKGALVHCGIMLKQKKAIIVEGVGQKANRAEMTIPPTPKAELLVTVDLTAGEVTLTVGDKSASLELKRAPKSIVYVGYSVQNAVAEFGAVEVERSM
jgi:hypothetical protein